MIIRPSAPASTLISDKSFADIRATQIIYTQCNNSRQLNQDNPNQTHGPHRLNRLNCWHSNHEQENANH